MKNLRGICTKLEFKAILYLKGLGNSEVIGVIRMEGYFSISYKRVEGFVSTTTIDHSEVFDCVQNHAKSLLINVQ